MKLPGGFGFPQERLVDSRLALRLKRLLGLVRSPSLEAATTVTPTVELVDFGAFLRDGIVRGIGGAGRAAAAGNKPFVGLVNPSTSGRVVVLRRTRIGTGNAGGILLKVEDGGAAGYTAGAVGIERRQWFSGHRNELFASLMWGDNVGGSPGGATVGTGQLIYLTVLANSPQSFDGGDYLVILRPGQSAYWVCDAVASTVFATFEWEEYDVADAL